MRDYYLHARVIHRVSRRLHRPLPGDALAVRAAVQRRSARRRSPTGSSCWTARCTWRTPTGVRSARIPARLMKVFWHRTSSASSLGIDVERAIEESLDLVDDAFRRSPEVRDLFLAICRKLGAHWQTLREMHELGVLGRYLPGVGRADLPRAVRRLPSGSPPTSTRSSPWRTWRRWPPASRRRRRASRRCSTR